MHQNIVLIVADTLRDKDIANENEELTPFLSKQRKIDSYYSNSPWTVPAHATMFTGLLPSEHGATTQNTFFDKSNELVNEFNTNGFHTLGLTENSLLSDKLGFGKDFDKFGASVKYFPDAISWNKIWENDPNYSGRVHKYLDFFIKVVLNKDIESVEALKKYMETKIKSEDYNPTYSSAILEKAVEELEKDRKSFVFLNLMPVHAPYTFNEVQREKFLLEFSEEKINNFASFDTLEEYLDFEESSSELFEVRKKAYKASINYFDSLMEILYSEAPEDTLFVVVGDHGELIGEYEKDGLRLVNHHFGTFKECINVPFYIYSKNQSFKLDFEDGIFDHRSLHEFMKGLARGSAEIKPKEMIQSEYFGKSGFNQQFAVEIPAEYEELFDRKSFSIISEEYKYDQASDGKFLWARGSKTEEDSLELSFLPQELENKMDIMYGWRIN